MQYGFRDRYAGFGIGCKGSISFSNGGLILLRPIFFNRTVFHRPSARHTMLIVVLASLFFCIAPVQAEPLRVTVVLSEEGGAYQAFSDLLRVKLPVAKFALNTLNIDQALVASDLYIAVGTKAATGMASRDVPVLNVLVPKTAYEKLPRGSSQHPAPRSAVFLDQPMERQVALLLAALPATRNVGVLYSSPPQELPSVKHLLAEKNVRLHDRAVDGTQSLNDALEAILSESDVLFVLADPVVYNAGTIRNILLTSYRKQIPLIGISQTYVKAGALCAIYSTPDQIAAQTAEVIRHYSESGKLPPAQYPKDFDVSVNTQVARSLDIPVKDAAQLREELRRVP